MEFKQNKGEMNFIEQVLSDDPCVNIVTKEQFEDRVRKVFNILWEKLSKSFGPGGAGTFISIYPAYYNTKDGFTIMKNIAFDNKLDQVICDMVAKICNRLNFTVGDGTTTATIATQSTYNAYLQNKEFFTKNCILPRDIMRRFEKYKTTLLDLLNQEAIDIRSDDPATLEENIRNVVYISSNGDADITDMIGSLYRELMYPAITCTLSPDGITRANIIDGYKMDVVLTDKLYINNDNQTMALVGADVIMFDHKVGKDTYEKILKPLSDGCRGRGRHLVCMAPFYDDTAINTIIQKDLNNEYRKNNDINLVLTVCPKATGNTKVSLNDLAMLLNTQLITPEMETEYLKLLENDSIYRIFNMDQRKIPGITVCVMKSENTLSPTTYYDGLENIFDYFDSDMGIRLGYCDSMELGLKESSFHGFYYDENLYNTYLSVAKTELAEVKKKCEQIGTFSVELNEKQKRVNMLGLKTAVIEVGSTSEITQGYMKDVMDDAIKAAASAYNNGVVLGCNVSLMRCITSLLDNPESGYDNIDHVLLSMLLDGFKAVYRTVLGNVFSDTIVLAEGTSGVMNTVELYRQNMMEAIHNRTQYKQFVVKPEEFKNASAKIGLNTDLHDAIIAISICNNEVFDLSTGTFADTVVNSTETDREILKATVDLLSLLITGNQLVLR